MRRPQCLIYSIAMVLDKDPEEVIEGLGTDGLDVIWPELPLPLCLRGVHIQEMVDYCLDNGHAVVEITGLPTIQPHGHPECDELSVFEAPEGRLEQRLVGNKAILTSYTHACAWDGSMVHDPAGGIYDIELFELARAYLVLPVLF